MRDLKMESGNKEESRIARGFRASRCPRMEYPRQYARCTVTSISEEKPLTQSQAKFYECSYKPMLAVRWTGDRETVRIVSVISRRYLFRVCISTTLFLSLLHREDFHIPNQNERVRNHCRWIMLIILERKNFIFLFLRWYASFVQKRFARKCE